MDDNTCDDCDYTKQKSTSSLEITFTTLNMTKENSLGNGSHAINGITISWTNASKWTYSNTSYLQIGSGSKTGSMQNTSAFPGRITKIELFTTTGSQGNPNNATITFGTSSSSIKSDSWTTAFNSTKGASDSHELSASSNYTFFKLAQTKGGFYDKIVITYETD